MAYDITGEFRTFVDQKRKDPSDSQRTKPGGRLPHPTPGDIQMDGAPSFMQVYMKEAYTIVSHFYCFCYYWTLTREKLQQIGYLTRMLAAVRRAYLDVHARLPVTRQGARAPDTTGVDAWADIKYFTNAERDQIDVQARQILARCAERVHDMETLEKRASSHPLSLPFS